MIQHPEPNSKPKPNKKTARKSVAVFFTGGTIAMRRLPGQGTIDVRVIFDRYTR